MCCEVDNRVFRGAPVPKAIGTTPEWIVLADTDKMNKSVAIRHPNIYVTLCINRFNIALNAFVDNGQQMAPIECNWQTFLKGFSLSLLIIVLHNIHLKCRLCLVEVKGTSSLISSLLNPP